MIEERISGMVIYTPNIPTTRIVIAAHGAGERGNDLQFMLNGSQLIRDLSAMVDKRGYTLICPQLGTNLNWNASGYAMLNKAYAEGVVRGGKQFYIVGHSLGGSALGYYSRNKYISAFLIISGIRATDLGRGYPVMYVHDQNDDIVRIPEAEANQAATGGVLDRVAGYGHNLTPIIQTNPKYMDWLLGQGGVVIQPKPPQPAPVLTITGPDTVSTGSFTLKAEGVLGEVTWFINTLSGGDYSISYEGNSIYGNPKTFSNMGPGVYEASAKVGGVSATKQITVTAANTVPREVVKLSTGETITLEKREGKWVVI